MTNTDGTTIITLTCEVPDLEARALTACRGDGVAMAPWNKLTPRERQIAARIAQGVATRAIAGELRISTKTVDSHRAHLLAKLQCPNNVVLSRIATRDGFIAPIADEEARLV